MYNKSIKTTFFIFICLAILGCAKDETTDTDKEPAQNTLGIEDKVLLWLDAKHVESLELNDYDRVISWKNKINDKRAITEGTMLTYDPINESVVADFSGALGVEDLGGDAKSFYLVGAILDSSSYCTVLGNTSTDDGVKDTRYLIREFGTSRFSGEVDGYINRVDTLADCFKVNFPGNFDVNVFHANVNTNDISSSFYVGNKGNGQGGKYAYKEIIVLKEDLNKQEADSVLNYLMTRWDVK